ncbi:MAG TPA: NADPH-glutathione reductase, partial [Rhodobacteraceae bacterium]|nr:NADPH-glutathione reductase [Paracoccaceae bacterium]
MKFDYDLFVIGGGSGGVRAGRLAASEAGAKVALAEEYRMGGTCVIRGCVPKKLMVFASGYSGANADARAYGWSDASIGAFDWPHFKAKLDAELDRLENIYRTNLAKAGVEIFNARAEMVDAHTVKLSSGGTFTAKHILIAVGGRPFTPEFEGSDLTITSNDIFKLEKLPRSILIVGGGFIACEFACILNGLGVEVTQFYRGAQILRGFDDEARGHVADLVRERGVDLHVGTDVMKIEKDDQGLFVKCTTGHDHHFDAVMYATGRVPNTDNLGLENTGVKLGRKGEIIVDEYSQTAVPSIYAVGDVTDRINLTPVAIREGAAFVDTVFHGKPTKADHELVASAVFTQPELGTVGM